MFLSRISYQNLTKLKKKKNHFWIPPSLAPSPNFSAPRHIYGTRYTYHQISFVWHRSEWEYAESSQPNQDILKKKKKKDKTKKIRFFICSNFEFCEESQAEDISVSSYSCSKLYLNKYHQLLRTWGGEKSFTPTN